MRNFKFLSLLMFVVLSVGFAACGDDDDDDDDGGGSVTASALIGTWETYWTTGYEKATGEEELRWDKAVSEAEKDRITFSADGTVLDEEDPQTWKLNGNKLTITDTDGEDSKTFTVLKLTSTELVVEKHIKETVAGVQYEYYDKSTFKKVK